MRAIGSILFMVLLVSGTTATLARVLAPLPAAKSEIHVSPDGQGDYRSIQAAIDGALSGATVFVHPGLYREGLRINKSLNVIGQGPRTDIRIEARGADAILFEAEEGRVANLTLRQMDTGQSGEKWYGIDIASGEPIIENVDVSSRSLTNIAIHNAADPIVRNSLIHGGRQAGIVVYDGGRGTIKSNQIVGNAYAGIEIDTGGRPHIIGNHVRRNGLQGIWVHSGGSGRFENNDLRDNARGPWYIEASAGAVYRRNNRP